MFILPNSRENTTLLIRVPKKKEKKERERERQLQKATQRLIITTSINSPKFVLS